MLTPVPPQGPLNASPSPAASAAPPVPPRDAPHAPSDSLTISARAAQPARPSLSMPSLRTLRDTERNLATLRAVAQQDGSPSVITSDGKTLSYFNGPLHTESKVAHLAADQAISLADRMTVNGKKATVLYTDDGFGEIDQHAVTVAVIDSGVDPNTRILKGRLLPGYNAGTHGTDTADDADGHGTFVATVVAGSDTADGVAKGVNILPIKIPDIEDDAKFLPELADSIRYAVDHGARVLNVSLCSNFGDPAIPWAIAPSDPNQLHEQIQAVRDALAYAEQHGAVVVAAAGNEGSKALNTVLFPADQDTVVAVSNLDDTKGSHALNPDSSRGPAVDLAAPGTGVFAYFGAGYAYWEGTSFAAPRVAGIAALILARHPDWSPAQVREQLYRTAHDLGDPGRDDLYGHGEVDAIRAVFEN